MKIEDTGTLSTFEALPTEEALYLSAIRYVGGTWFGGPYAKDKEELIRALQTWGSIEAARIYRVTVPAKPMPAA